MGLTRVTLQTSLELLVEGADSLSTREALAACQMLGIVAQRALPAEREASPELWAAAAKLDMWILVEPVSAASRVKELRAAGFGACIYVVAAAKSSPELEAAVLDAGADGYSVRPFAQDTLAARLRSTLRRNSGTYRALRPTKVTLRSHDRVLLVGTTEHQLSPRELALVEYLLPRAGNWVRRDDVMQALFGAQNGYDSSILRTHLLNIRKKLGADAWILRSDRWEGLMLVADAASTGDASDA